MRKLKLKHEFSVAFGQVGLRENLKRNSKRRTIYCAQTSGHQQNNDVVIKWAEREWWKRKCVSLSKKRILNSLHESWPITIGVWFFNGIHFVKFLSQYIMFSLVKGLVQSATWARIPQQKNIVYHEKNKNVKRKMKNLPCQDYILLSFIIANFFFA